MAPRKLHWLQPFLWPRSIPDSPGLSSAAKIGLVSAGVVTFVLLVSIVAFCLYRYRNGRHPKRAASRITWGDLHSVENNCIAPFQYDYATRLNVRSISDSIWVPESSINMGVPVRHPYSPQEEIFAIPRDIWAPSPYEKELIAPVHNRDRAKDDSIPDSPPMFRCEEAGCSRTFGNQNEYKHHMRYHIKPEQCPHCSKSFGTSKDLKRHINAVHETTDKYFCTVAECKYVEKGFARKDHLTRHVKNVHG